MKKALKTEVVEWAPAAMWWHYKALGFRKLSTDRKRKGWVQMMSVAIDADKLKEIDEGPLWYGEQQE